MLRRYDNIEYYGKSFELCWSFVCIIWLVCLVLQMLVTKIFLSRLKRLFPATWKQLGELVNLMGTFEFLKLLWRKEFDLLRDEKIVVVGR